MVLRSSASRDSSKVRRLGMRRTNPRRAGGCHVLGTVAAGERGDGSDGDVGEGMTREEQRWMMMV
jgi:hypothetical protein